jgi:uncharacterized protein (DUF849 family)
LQPLIIEAAINGATPKARNPNTPKTPAEIAADAVACLSAGAAIVHNHIADYQSRGDDGGEGLCARLGADPGAASRRHPLRHGGGRAHI